VFGTAAVKPALVRIDAIQSSRNTSSAEDKDRRFGRGKLARA
jgi:hypothetical protein